MGNMTRQSTADHARPATTLTAPFPYFGGKRRVAGIAWQRFGDVPNYVEPFCGSAAVLLARPHAPKTETVNDANCYLANFWRALQHDPDGVATWADYPVSEIDLLARHRWLVKSAPAADFRARMAADPDYYDAKMAGWWVWGACAWIGAGWCDYASADVEQLPHLGDAGRGINRKLPHLGDAGRGNTGEAIVAYFRELADRLRRVRVACGDWARVLGDSVTIRHGLTAVFLDPPYGVTERSDTYAVESRDVSADVRAWALAHGDNPLYRIALCGYEGEHAMPDTWACVAWKAAGGYGSQGDGQGRDNAARERIWFSPHCLRPDAPVHQLVFPIDDVEE
jgi:DNA adenine methylase